MEYPTSEEMKAQIGDNVVQFRKLRNMSQADLCYAADIDISTLSRIERGELNSTFETYYKICRVLKVDVYQLFILKQ